MNIISLVGARHNFMKIAPFIKAISRFNVFKAHHDFWVMGLSLLAAFSIFSNKYPKIHLLIIGDITNGKFILNSLKALARELGIINKITFTGLVSSERIPELLNSCDALALTRPKGLFAEAGFPTKLGEYFACKKPVLITKVGDIMKCFEDKKHVVMVNPDDPKDIAKGFEFLYNHLDISEKIALNGYNWMMENLYYKRQLLKYRILLTTFVK